jgi:glycosyltransferase involved in cell wall biosynthesis
VRQSTKLCTPVNVFRVRASSKMCPVDQMQSIAEPVGASETSHDPASALDAQCLPVTLPVSVIIPVRNEGHNLRRCLDSLPSAGEIFVIDSQSTDDTTEIARSFGADVVQFYYSGGWPKKRQWALDTLPLHFEWVLLLDADEALPSELVAEIGRAIRNPGIDGYYIGLEIIFLGRRLRHSGATFHKLSLFRRAKGRFECRAQDQDTSMCDMEVHEHVIVNGATSKLKERISHWNVENLSRYIQKHNEYSNWEARVWNERSAPDELRPALFGTQAQRRRWLRKAIFMWPGSPVLFFFYKYVMCLGFLDRGPGLIYCGLQAVQFFHIKAKIYESKLAFPKISPASQLSAAKD